jgi:hypothetical protein
LATIGAGTVTVGAVVSRTTTTWKLAEEVFPAVSVAVQLTVVVPTGKVLLEAGEQLTVAASSGSVAVTE